MWLTVLAGQVDACALNSLSGPELCGKASHGSSPACAGLGLGCLGKGGAQTPELRPCHLAESALLWDFPWSLKGDQFSFLQIVFFLTFLLFFFYIFYSPPLILSLSITSQRIKGILLGLLFLTPVVGEDSINMPLVLVNMFYWLTACLNMLHTHCSLSLHLFCPSLTVCSLFTMSSLLGIFVYPSHPAIRL